MEGEGAGEGAPWAGPRCYGCGEPTARALTCLVPGMAPLCATSTVPGRAQSTCAALVMPPRLRLCRYQKRNRVDMNRVLGRRRASWGSGLRCGWVGTALLLRDTFVEWHQCPRAARRISDLASLPEGDPANPAT